MYEDTFIERYLEFYAGTEPPTIYNRWCAIGGIAALLGRQAWIQHGHSKIYPNQYIMLVGEAGCRKSTAIKVFLKPLITEAGITKIAASKTSKEKFLMDLERGMDNVTDPEDNLHINGETKDWGKGKTLRQLFGVVDATEPAECLIMADEFNVFMGHSNVEFIDMLTDLWDYSGIYTQRTKTGKSVLVPNPTISLLGGNTQVGISMSFPTEVIGQGFFSRLLLIHADPSGRRITRPPAPDLQLKADLVARLTRIKGKIQGEVLVEESAWDHLNEIYQEWKDLEDVRFKSYSTRRLTHLIKLCLCCAASAEQQLVTTATVEYANSILHYTEFFMPKALGEFGKARNSDVSAKILTLLEKADHPLDVFGEIFPQVSRDIATTTELAQILGAMKAAGKIQQTTTGKILAQAKVMSFNFPHCKVSLLREYLELREAQGMPI